MSNPFRPALATALALVVGGCASIVEGTSQTIALSVTPQNASCTGSRNGEQVGTYDSASGSFHVGKSRNALTITCEAPGYRQRSIRIDSDASGWGVAGALTLDFGLTDYATGALNKYPAQAAITLEPDYAAYPGVAAAPPAAPAVTSPAAVPVQPAAAYAVPSGYALVPVAPVAPGATPCRMPDGSVRSDLSPAVCTAAFRGTIVR